MKTHNDWAVLLQLAYAGDNIAQFKGATGLDYGLLIDTIEVAQEDKQKAFDWYYKAYENGNADAVIRVADFLSEGVYCDRNIELAVELYKKEIGNCSGIAANNLATIYRDNQQFEKAFDLYQVAQGLNKSNLLQLALCYHYGVGTEKNIGKAHELFLKISEHTSDANNTQYEISEANYLLGMMYLDGEVVDKSIDKARHFLMLADADNEHRSAQELLIIIGRDRQNA